jgi:leucyl-tRNA synthetase
VFDAAGIPQLVSTLPVVLPEVERYTPTGTGESPLAAVTEWVTTPSGTRETDTMPGWAGSSWYFLRYTDPHNSEAFAGKENLNYWNQVDLYVGGSEHATGHLLYSRFWTKFLFDLGYLSWDEPFRRLVNQGMIMGEDGQKMSKRWGNVVNPDDVCARYGADTLRLYEMFLGPLTDSKPWNTHGIEGVSRFLNKFWRLFMEGENWVVGEAEATPEELKILHKTIRKVQGDIEQMSFNTSVSAFMVAVNELTALGCRKRAVLEPLLIILAPFAPHISEDLYARHGHTTSIHQASWPAYDEALLVENEVVYPVSVNGKTRTQLRFAADTAASEIEKAVLEDEVVQRWLEGKAPRKIIVVPGRIVNVVI